LNGDWLQSLRLFFSNFVIFLGFVRFSAKKIALGIPYGKSEYLDEFCPDFGAVCVF
jgi:hypothetical protein